MNVMRILKLFYCLVEFHRVGLTHSNVIFFSMMKSILYPQRTVQRLAGGKKILKIKFYHCLNTLYFMNVVQT
jgi:hypothetical protein